MNQYGMDRWRHAYLFMGHGIYKYNKYVLSVISIKHSPVFEFQYFVISYDNVNSKVTCNIKPHAFT